MGNAETILLAEDDQNDAFLVQSAFARAGYKYTFAVVCNGEEAINYFQGEGKFADRNAYPIPALLLLDLKMPGVDGFEVLRWVRSQPGWKTLPIIVLTNSCYDPDINQAYDLGANSFLTKPGDLIKYVGVVKLVVDFWLIRAVLPGAGPVAIRHESQTDSSNIPVSSPTDRQPAIDGVERLRALPTPPAENCPPSSSPPAV